MGIKLYISKAHDMVEWYFLEWMLNRLHFPSYFSLLITQYVKSISFQVLVNWQPSRRFRSEHGLWQGNPLSSVLFTICAEGLSALIRKEVAAKIIQGARMGANGPEISYLFFANDSLLFTRSTHTDAMVLKSVLA